MTDIVADRRKARRALLLRVAVTVSLVSVLIWSVNPAFIWSKVVTLDPLWIVIAFLAVFVAIAISALKWGFILKARGHVLGYGRLLRHYFVGLFFNNVLPTTVGGDAVRAWETTKDTGETPEAVGSVVSERLIAGLALGITTVVGLPFVVVDAKLAAFVAIFLAVDILLVALFLLPKVADGVIASLAPRRASGVADSASRTVGAVRSTFRDRRLVIKVFAYSIAFQILVAAVNFCIFRAMGIPIGLAHCVVFTPMIFTVTMLPISLSGLGVREAAYWYFFSQVGVSQLDAVTASLLFFVIVGIASLPGAPLFALRRRATPGLIADTGRNFAHSTPQELT